jgi:hypothetical protein
MEYLAAYQWRCGLPRQQLAQKPGFSCRLERFILFNVVRRALASEPGSDMHGVVAHVHGSADRPGRAGLCLAVNDAPLPRLASRGRARDPQASCSRARCGAADCGAKLQGY